MESTSFPMSVQLSEAAVNDSGMPEDFCPLGRRTIKGKGIMSTYLLKVALCYLYTWVVLWLSNGAIPCLLPG